MLVGEKNSNLVQKNVTKNLKVEYYIGTSYKYMTQIMKLQENCVVFFCTLHFIR